MDATGRKAFMALKDCISDLPILPDREMGRHLPSNCKISSRLRVRRFFYGLQARRIDSELRIDGHWDEEQSEMERDDMQYNRDALACVLSGRPNHPRGSRRMGQFTKRHLTKCLQLQISQN
jgi:hypothetical protein